MAPDESKPRSSLSREASSNCVGIDSLNCKWSERLKRSFSCWASRVSLSKLVSIMAGDMNPEEEKVVVWVKGTLRMIVMTSPTWTVLMPPAMTVMLPDCIWFWELYPPPETV